MGGCSSQQIIDSDAMLAEHESCAVADKAAGDEVQNIPGQVPVQGGSSEYIGAYVENGMAHQNTVEPPLPVSNDQTEQPVLRVSPNVHQNISEPIFDVPIENTVKTSVDEPIIYQTFEEQPVAEEIVYQILEEQPVTLPVSNQFEEIFLPVTSDVHYDYQNGNDAVFDVPTETMVKTIVDEPLSQPFEEHPMVERTLPNPVIEEQPVIEQTVKSQIFEVQPVHTVSFGDHAVLPTQSPETHASVEVNENIDVVEVQPHELGIVFEGRTYQTRVFDANLKEYVYVGENCVKPRGGLVM